MEEQQKPDMGKADSTGSPREDLGEKVLGDIKSDFKVVGSSRVKNWYLWLALAIIIGVSGGIGYVANRSGEFVDSEAAQNKAEGIVILGYEEFAQKHDVKGAKLFAVEWHKAQHVVKDGLTKEELSNEFPRTPDMYMKLADGVLQSSYESIGKITAGANTKNHVVLFPGAKRGGTFLMAHPIGEQATVIWYSGKLTKGAYEINSAAAPDIDTRNKLPSLEIKVAVRDLSKKDVADEKIEIERIEVLSSFAQYPVHADIPFSREYGTYLIQGNGTGDSSAATIIPDEQGRYIIKNMPRNEPVIFRIVAKAPSGKGKITIRKNVQFTVPDMDGVDSAIAEVRMILRELSDKEATAVRPVVNMFFK